MFFCPVKDCPKSQNGEFTGFARKNNAFTPHISAHVAAKDISIPELHKAGYQVCRGCFAAAVPQKFFKRGTCSACVKKGCVLTAPVIPPCPFTPDVSPPPPPPPPPPAKPPEARPPTVELKDIGATKLQEVKDRPSASPCANSSSAPLFESKLSAEAKEWAPGAPPAVVPSGSLEGHLEGFWRRHAVEAVWETRVPTLTRLPKKLIGPLSSAWLSVLHHRLRNWSS